MSKDFKQFAYFVSRASNFAIAIKPDKKKMVDGEMKFEPGLRVEFNNKMLAIEKTPENKKIIEILRKMIQDQQMFDPKRRTFYEESEPRVMVSEETVVMALDEKDKIIKQKDKEIAELKKGPISKENTSKE